MTPSDTSPKAGEIYHRLLAEMTPSERLAVGAALWTAGNKLQRASLRRLYPDADEAEITFQIAITRFGEDLARRIYRRS